MKQTYHSNAKTNVHYRSEIKKSDLSNLQLSEKYQISLNTVSKWKNRKSPEDKSSKPYNIKYSLSELDMLIAIELRVLTWWALDEITEAVNPIAPEKIRSAVYRTFVFRRFSIFPF